MNSLMYEDTTSICEIEVNERSVVSYGTRSFPSLRFSARITKMGTVPVSHSRQEPGRPYSIINHAFGLYLGKGRKYGGQFLTPVLCSGLPIQSFMSGTTHLEFIAPLDFFKLEAIERERSKDINLAISGTAILAIHPTEEHRNESGILQIEGYSEAELELEYHIAQSDWIEKVLSKMGHRKFHLLELDLTHCEIQKALEYLVDAEQGLDEGNLEMMAIKCREIVSHLSKSYLRLASDDSRKDKWIPVSKCVSDFASKALHREDINSSRANDDHLVFSRSDAEYLLILTKALIRYAQQLKGQREA